MPTQHPDIAPATFSVEHNPRISAHRAYFLCMRAPESCFLYALQVTNTPFRPTGGCGCAISCIRDVSSLLEFSMYASHHCTSPLCHTPLAQCCPLNYCLPGSCSRVSLGAGLANGSSRGQSACFHRRRSAFQILALDFYGVLCNMFPSAVYTWLCGFVAVGKLLV